jgi:hypothetical protein
MAKASVSMPFGCKKTKRAKALQAFCEDCLSGCVAGWVKAISGGYKPFFWVTAVCPKPSLCHINCLEGESVVT